MKDQYRKLISRGAAVALAGYILSGPVAFLLIRSIKPQPAWTTAANFAAHYSSIQDLPYYFGFLLIGGMLVLAAGHYLGFKEDDAKKKFRLLAAFGWTTVFCTLIAFNYICQTGFVHNLALHYKPEYDPAIAAFSMSNPISFCWANEMWGYAFLGLATWLMAGYYKERDELIRMLLIANGVLSIAGAVWTNIDISWVMTTAGLIGYFAWNVLMIVLMILIYIHSKKNSHENKQRMAPQTPHAQKPIL